MKEYIEYSLNINNSSNLPEYPIPELDDVLDRFIEWSKPLLSNEQLIEAIRIVDEFKLSKDSKLLENKLRELGSRKNNSWIFDYWVKYHLEVRDSLSPYTNVPVIYENKKLSKFDPIVKATKLIQAVSRVYLDFKKRGNGSYNIGKKEYSNDQFHGLLGSINHIEEDLDKYYINPGISKNVIIIYKNNIYSLDVINEDNELMSSDEIFCSLENVVKLCSGVCSPNINHVTAEPDRDKAARMLNKILENDINRKNYEPVMESIFVLNLDEGNESVGFKDELYNACLHSEYFNRWHGKGLQFSISGDGVVSFIVDHSFCDGGTEIYLINEMHDIIDETLPMLKNPAKDVVKELNFVLSKDVKKDLLVSELDNKKNMNRYKAEYVDLENLTRSKLKEKGILSGDGFIHIAMQGAQYLTYNEIYNTYISVDARKFFRGRTECNRPVTEESVEFIKMLTEEKRHEKPELRESLKKALDAHHRRVKLCQSGNGVNRYLHVLKEVCKDYSQELGIEREPDLFGSEAFSIIGENRLSTTSFGHEDIKYLYFPPVMDSGLGIYYWVGEESFAIITSFNEDYGKMLEFNKNLKICVDKMLEL